ncbi:MAG TPA: L,D-transpeptidase family protein [Acidimicrobiales bacterium]|nr:L,D-transpeptidase family protein [Acidimicrobiales bacterium]
MLRRRAVPTILALGLLGAGLAPAVDAGASGASGASGAIAVRSMIPASLSSSLPLVRLHFSAPTNAGSLPPLHVSPTLNTKWQQISPRDVQAVVTSKLRPSVVYTISTPTQMSCASGCAFTRLRAHTAWVSTNLTWEAQLLAELNYLPVAFTSSTPQSDPSQSVSGHFTWKYADLPTRLSSQWSLGSDNVILHGALMDFQNVNQLPVTGVPDAATWSALIAAVQGNKVNPGTYNYVDVSMSSPETLTLYVAGHSKFHALVNTGISVSPTATGTYPVYLRYTSQTMSGTNPDGTHYSDPGIPWISYFNGGDALHGFIRSSYGWPQSLGCVEMPFASAKIVWPYTPLGTLVTVH